MPRKALMWLVIADTAILFLVTRLVAGHLLSARVAGFSILGVWMGNFAIAWWLGKRARGGASPAAFALGFDVGVVRRVALYPCGAGIRRPLRC